MPTRLRFQLTVVDAIFARRNQTRNILRDGVIFDSSVLLQFKGALYEGIAGDTEQSVVNDRCAVR